MDTISLAELLSSYRYKYITETDLQNGIEEVLIKSGIAYKRELSLSTRDRPDFLIDEIAVEVKIKGTLSQLLRQITRYVSHKEVSTVLVVGTPAWLNQIPSHIDGKAIYSSRFLGSML